MTRSPATMPSPSAPSVTAASPVSTPARARSSSAPTSCPSADTAATRSSAARTARSASSSVAVGVPHTAITASPMNFSTVPPYSSIRRRQMSKYRERSSRTSSASRDSESGVNPTRSANSTETRRRSAAGASRVAVPAGASRRCRGVGRSALPAELLVARERGAARRARERERRTALGAELLALGVLRTTSSNRPFRAQTNSPASGGQAAEPGVTLAAMAGWKSDALIVDAVRSPIGKRNGTPRIDPRRRALRAGAERPRLAARPRPGRGRGRADGLRHADRRAGLEHRAHGAHGRRLAGDGLRHERRPAVRARRCRPPSTAPPPSGRGSSTSWSRPGSR